MADPTRVNSSLAAEKDKMQENVCPDEDVDEGNIDDFVMDEYNKQRKQMTAEEAERSDNFIMKALTEREKMNAAISKSQSRSAQLHAEFGSEVIHTWQKEHAEQVLTPEQTKALNLQENGECKHFGHQHIICGVSCRFHLPAKPVDTCSQHGLP